MSGKNNNAPASSESGRKLMMLNEYVHYQPGHLLRRAHQIAWATFMERTENLDVTPAQYSLLVAAFEFPALDATRLRELISIDRATIGNVVQRLESKGLLIRRTDSNDRRAKRIYITDKGRELVEHVNSIRVEIGEELLSPLSMTERKTLLRLLKKLVSIDDVVAKSLLIHATPPGSEVPESKKIEAD